MANDVTITIKGKDGVSQTFRAIGQSADQMSTKVEQGSNRSAESMKKWGDAAQAVGLAIGTLALVSSKAAADAEASQVRLEQSFENAGLAIEDYQDQIDRVNEQGLDLAFDDEDTQDALSDLINVTGDAEDAFYDLGIAQDIARGRGIDLEAATRLVIAAENERFGILSKVGIQIDENATSEEALALLQEKYSGQAEAYAETSAASYDRIGNAIENALESVGNFVNDNAGVVIALTGVASAAKPAADAFTSLKSAANLSSLAIGPVGMVAAGVALIGTLALLATQQEANTLSTEKLTNMMNENTTSILDNASAWDRLGLLTAAQNVDNSFNQLITSGNDAQETLDNITGAMTELNLEMGGLLPVDRFEWLSEADAAWLESAFGNGDAVLSMEELTLAQDAYNNSLRLTADQAKEVDASFDQAMAWARDPNYNGGEILADINAILNNPDLTGEEVVAAFDALIAKQEEYNIIVQRTKEAQEAQIYSTITANKEWHASVPVLDAATTALDGTANAANNLNESVSGPFNIDIDYSDATTTTGLLGTLAAQMAALDGTSATVYINGVRTGFTEGDYATGGMVNVRLAEMGPERLQFANGGSAIAPHDGNYLIPNGTYVSPAAATRAGGGGSVGKQMVFNAPVYIYPATPDIHDAISSTLLRGGR